MAESLLFRGFFVRRFHVSQFDPFPTIVLSTDIRDPISLVPEIVLNEGQQEAADGFFEFLFNDEKELIISGGGGTGKTKLMAYLIDKVMPRYFEMCQLMNIPPKYDSVEMLATTNKAAQVLGENTKRQTGTAASFLNLKVQDDYKTGKSKLVKTGNWKVYQRKVIFIDECSIIDPPLESAILEGTHNCKIVYVGDHCQLAPVGYESSPIYRRNIPFYNLTQPMRNAAQPALMAICQQLRETVETGIFKPIHTVPGVIDHLDDNEMQVMLAQVFKNQTRDSRILAYTNDRVVAYNEHIRSMRGLPDEYGLGEVLVNNQAISFDRRHTLSVEADVEITEIAPYTDHMVIEDQDEYVTLEVRRATLSTPLMQVIENVPLPVDRAHYAALIKYYAKQKRWERMYFIKNHVPDLRPRDASTVYKAQGSTYESVFIDLGNLSLCNKSPEVARALYVAFSRATTRVFLYGQLAQKYGGLLKETA
jgi:hypothetical protein